MEPRLASASQIPPRFFRFGPFELDVRAGELRKHGTKLRLRTQPLQILLILLEHSGDVVLREEIRKLLWPEDTTVEFDRGINAAVQRLRDALGESADDPRYIETLPKRGYRFLIEVERIGEEPASLAPAVAGVSPTALVQPAGPSSTQPAARPWHPYVHVTTVVATACLLALLVWLGPWPSGKRTARPSGNFVLSLGLIPATLVSPNGTAVVFRIPGRGVFYRRLDSLAETPVFSSGPPISLGAWSPDSSQIAGISGRGVLIKKQVPNGPSVTICSGLGTERGLTWNAHGSILFAMIDEGEGRLYVVPDSGGSPVHVEVPALKHGFFFEPQFLPNGEDFLFAFAGEGDEEAGLYLATLRNAKVVKGPVRLRTNVTAGKFTPSAGGRLLYVQDATLFAQRLDVDNWTLRGEPERILDGVFSAEQSRTAAFSVSNNGVLVWRSGGKDRSQLTWFDRSGKFLGAAGPPDAISAVALSPDEKHLLVTIADRRSEIVEAYQGSYFALLGIIRRPVWMPDSSHILYCRWEPGRCRLMERLATGGPETEVAQLPEMASPRNVSPDGSVLLYEWKKLLYVTHIRGSAPKLLPELALRSFQQQFSPDGRWLVYSGYGVNELGMVQVFVRPFASGGFPIQIAPRAGGFAAWRGDGREIIYFHVERPDPNQGRQDGRSGMLQSVRVEVKGSEFHASPPQPLFPVTFSAGLPSDGNPIAVTRDGSRILFAQAVEQGDQPTYVMTAWEQQLTY
jgi:DNA-binding winged helix-turn-helix (wHTH) protein